MTDTLDLVLTHHWFDMIAHGDKREEYMPALTDNSKCMCTWGGQISITSPGNTMVSGK